MSMIGCYKSLPKSKLELIEADESQAEVCTDDETLPAIEIDKCWQAIHIALTGDPWGGSGPLANAVLGGREVGEDLGYGPARMLNAGEVKETSEALDKVSSEDFAKLIPACDFKTNDIYVFKDEDPKDSAIIEELTAYYTEVRQFFRAAADRGDGMLLFLS